MRHQDQVTRYDDEEVRDQAREAARRQERRENELMWGLYTAGLVDKQVEAGRAAIEETAKQPTQSRCSQIIGQVDDTILLHCQTLVSPSGAGESPETVEEAQARLDDGQPVGPYRLTPQQLRNYPEEVNDALKRGLAEAVARRGAVERLARTAERPPEWAQQVLDDTDRTTAEIRADLYSRDHLAQRDDQHVPATDIQQANSRAEGD